MINLLHSPITSKFAFCFILIGSIAACQQTSDQAEQTEFRSFTDSQINQLLVGNSLIGAATENAVWAVYYEASGVERGVYNGDPLIGKWRAKQGALCSDWGKGENCFTLYRHTSGEIQGFKDGKKIWAANLIHGNPKNL